MGRVLVIAIACVAGALVTWLFMPTIQRVQPKPDMPVFSQDSDSEAAPARKDTAKGTMMSAERRRARAEKLIGKPLKYITSEEVHSVAWFTEQGEQVIERAMDECYLVVEPELYAQHVLALSGEDIEDTSEDTEDTAEDVEDRVDADKLVGAFMTPPTLKQARNCLSVNRAYAALHGTTFDF